MDGVLFRAPSGAERPFGEGSDVGVEGGTPTTPVAFSGAIHADGSEAGGFSWVSRSGRRVSVQRLRDRESKSIRNNGPVIVSGDPPDSEGCLECKPGRPSSAPSLAGQPEATA